MESLNLNKLLNLFLEWKITFILHCDNDLLNNLYLYIFSNSKKMFVKIGRTTNKKFTFPWLRIRKALDNGNIGLGVYFD